MERTIFTRREIRSGLITLRGAKRGVRSVRRDVAVSRKPRPQGQASVPARVRYARGRGRHGGMPLRGYCTGRSNAIVLQEWEGIGYVPFGVTKSPSQDLVVAAASTGHIREGLRIACVGRSTFSCSVRSCCSAAGRRGSCTGRSTPRRTRMMLTPTAARPVSAWNRCTPVGRLASPAPCWRCRSRRRALMSPPALRRRRWWSPRPPQGRTRTTAGTPAFRPTGGRLLWLHIPVVSSEHRVNIERSLHP